MYIIKYAYILKNCIKNLSIPFYHNISEIPYVFLALMILFLKLFPKLSSNSIQIKTSS